VLKEDGWDSSRCCLLEVRVQQAQQMCSMSYVTTREPTVESDLTKHTLENDPANLIAGVLLLGKRLTSVQWVALLLLACGAALVQAGWAMKLRDWECLLKVFGKCLAPRAYNVEVARSTTQSRRWRAIPRVMHQSPSAKRLPRPRAGREQHVQRGLCEGHR